MARKVLLLALGLVMTGMAGAQTLGGSTVYNFLRFPATPLVTALGGENISVIGRESGMGFQNPALVRKEMHGQMQAVFSGIQSQVQQYHLAGAYHQESIQTSFSGHIQYFNYGNITQTDAAGNIQGSFKPRDFVVQVNASRQYLERWHYGMGIKFIQSDYGLYRSSALAMDFGVNYYDSSRLLQVGLVAKNMGFQLKAYEGTAKDNLPFDLQLGVTKRLAKAPIQFSVTAHHLHRLILNYNDTTFNAEVGVSPPDNGFEKALQHFVFATQFFIGDKLELSAGYNHLRRRELNIPNGANGLTGFSYGAAFLQPRWSIRYSHANYQGGKGYNQFGVVVSFEK
ncbi:type IX secretion system protein PorQ [Flavihumibacter rivuli]|uniref:type IX secretion system protein PorQ n=1 Tax=Flavihumibacter rivuli TaxID=2838156 RepID=UPI001BDF4639|nr:type IX secretion system protein PorQ [Flavihumibacter rivuli]ULQ57166.1 type IX secretion system protein PorQ [Flavihumibacter rivuli]